MRTVVKRTIMVIVAVAVMAAIVFAMLPQPLPVDVATVVIGPLSVTVDEEGKTRIRERYVVSSPLMGRLRRITLDPGDRVEAQQTVLAVIEPTEPGLLDARALAEAEARVRAADAAVRQAGAALARARAAHDFATNHLARVVAASEANASNRNEMDDARTQERTLAEELRGAEFGQEIAEYELEVARSALLYARGEGGADDQTRMEVRSPIDGAVLRVFQESVAVVSPGMPLIEVGDPQDLEVVVDVLSSDGARIQPGAKVAFDGWGGDHELRGTVRRVEPSAFTKISALGIEEQRVNVIVDLVTPPAQRESLGDGFRVDGHIVLWEQPSVLKVPMSALFRNGESWQAYVVENGRAAQRAIEVGGQNGLETEILGGLEAGDTIIIHPSDAVHAGLRVLPRKWPVR